MVERGAANRTLYLPPGTWHGFWTGEPVAGGREITRPVDLLTVPLYVRAGAILPLGPVKQYTGQQVDDPMELVVYPGADGAGNIYDDDGLSFEYRRGDWMGILTSWTDARRRLSLRLAPAPRPRQPLPRRFTVRVAGWTSTREVVFDGSRVSIEL